MSNLFSEIQIKMKNKSNSEVNRLTREAIATALVELLRKQDFEKITISSIVKLAGVSRTAYYNNYNSKDEILNDLIDNFIEEVNSGLKPYVDPVSGKTNNPKQFIFNLFEIVFNHRTLYATLINAGLSHQILKQLNDLMLKYSHAATKLEKYQVYLQSGALFNVFTLWIANGTKESCLEMTNIFTKLYSTFW
ncbi:TetR/AcrR family transcriptional regulator [Liquorilactobacillus mali]|uniref:TetR/AcrR family transcriptional regulator n=1 Tax=Liquorilactobacillus mali TaxID=1618 RepID=UPI002350EDFD|nr:TetR/AcrR family transcriptional regulator [Liquorilactobacillus mali]MDC7952231.1 TetR/AcrR family transcriptional regulator [Liquorilactobacillus mali]